MKRKLELRVRYWYRKIYINVTGKCPDCSNDLNFNSYGQGFCPECGSKKG